MQINIFPFHLIRATSARCSLLKQEPCFSTKASTTSKPILCLVWAYSAPGFPKPTMRYLLMTKAVTKNPILNELGDFYKIQANHLARTIS